MLILIQYCLKVPALTQKNVPISLQIRTFFVFLSSSKVFEKGSGEKLFSKSFSPRKSFLSIFRSINHRLLQYRAQPVEVFREAADAHDKALVFFRMHQSVEQFFL